MPKTEVILTHNIVGLGAESDQVKVAAGYARNYLFPQGFAIPLTSANKRRLEALKQRRAVRETEELNHMNELSRSLAKLVAVITVKTGEDGKMFGSVTSGMIADELKHQFDISLDKKKIHLEHPIKTIGEYEIELHLHTDVKSTLKVHVQSLSGVIAPVAAPAENAEEARKPKTEKRGYGKREAEKAEAAPEEKEKKSHAAKGEKPVKAKHEAKPEKKSKAE